jgi:hypothetical protein
MNTCSTGGIVTLELSKVTQQVTQLGEQAAQRAQRVQQTVPDIIRRLIEFAADAELREVVESAVRAGWSGAVPAHEPLDGIYSPDRLPERLTIVAADGSQIYPDRHGLALYYAVNLGGIVLRLGSGEAPQVESEPTLCFTDEVLYDDQGNVIASQLINARRTVQEIVTLTRLVCAETGETPIVALSDGNIALRVKQESIPAREGAALQAEYMAQLNRLRAAGVTVGSFITRPSATSVVRLMHLATECPRDRIAEYVQNRPRPFEGINDTPVFAALLKPGDRSALFKQTTQWSKPYEEAGHAIYFFYVNVSTAERNALVRIELPEWVAANPDRVALLHAVVIDQCRVTNEPYPYVLTRADELAVITTREKTALDDLIAAEMLAHELTALPSEKAATKTLARYGKRH